MIDPSLIGPTTLAISQAISSFNTFLPSLSEIRKNDPMNDPEFTADVRMGEVAAVVITIGVGAIVSSLTGSSAPAIVALIASLGLVLLYETTLRAQRPLESKAV
jgi:hypothetical protein